MELKQISAKVVYGLQSRTNNHAEMGANGIIPGLWQRFDGQVPVDYQGGERVYGVYFDYQSDHNGDFSVLAGSDGLAASNQPTLTQVDVPAGEYLVFSKTGDMPQIAIDVWTQVWQYFASQDAQYRRLFTTDFEFYPSANAIELHIAVAQG